MVTPRVSPEPTPAPNVPVGAACIRDRDCGTGICLDLFPGGYCSEDCTSAACPAGSCASVAGVGMRCLRDCDRDAQCREAEGYACDNFGTCFPDPGGPDCVPSEEQCNNIDDDCDGETDEDLREACGTDVGVCRVGQRRCSAGEWGRCLGSVEPEDEVCDDVDNDCDGSTDETCVCRSGETRNCGTNEGECERGTQRCVQGAFGSCEGGVMPADAEACNGLDDDCDGETDEGCDCVDGETTPCGTDEGECSRGVRTCVDGEFGECDGDAGGDELCDGLDNDCDGETDEDFDIGSACGGEGSCGSGAWACDGPMTRRCDRPNGCIDGAPCVEIPDDGLDNDCDGGDAGNSESRGFYVNGGAPAVCPALDPPGSAACPFTELWRAILEAENQDWSPGQRPRREIYIAAGTYSDPGTAATLNRPLQLIGGYVAGATAPWTRDLENAETRIDAGTDAVRITETAGEGGTAVLDGILIDSGELDVSAPAVIRNSVVQALRGIADLSFADSELAQGVGRVAEGERWRIIRCEVGGNIDPGRSATDWIVEDSNLSGRIDVNGGRFLAGGWQVRRNDIGGGVWARSDDLNPHDDRNTSRWVIEDNTIRGSVACLANGHADCEWRVAGNDMVGKVQVRASSETNARMEVVDNILGQGIDSLGFSTFDDDTSQWIVRRNVIHSTVGFEERPCARCRFELSDNLIYGWVEMGGPTSEIKGNTFVTHDHSTLRSLTLRHEGIRVVNNLFVAVEPGLDNIVALDVWDTPGIIRNNAFAGFASHGGVIYQDRQDEVFTSAERLNLLSSLPAWGRGGNLSFDSITDLGLADADPSSETFGALAAGSPLIDAGLGLPFTPGDGSAVVDVHSPDRAGVTRPQGAGRDIGAHELEVR